jgi:hypothetical protein
LARLAVYIEDLDERERVWLNVMAKHVHADHQAAQFIEQLSRLVTKSPKAVGSATLELARHLERGFYDYKNGLSNLTAALIQSGLRLEGLEIAKSLHYLPEFRRIFERLTTS